jgi:imidazolonepropionase-like amidohydrolase
MIPAPRQTSPLLLSNGTIHTVTGATIENGDLLFENGKITAVTRNISPPKNCKVIDVGGKHIYPGLISSISTIGLVEISSVNETIDKGELELLNPSLRAQVAINPDSEVIPVTRANGILVAHVIPFNFRGGLIAGQSALVNLDGWKTEDMTIKAPVGMRITWPADPQLRDFSVDGSGTQNSQKAEEGYTNKIKQLEDAFADARAFWKAKEKGNKPLDVDLHWEALGPVLDQEIPVMVYANTSRQIRDAVHWATRENLTMVLLGGTDAWRLPELLQETGVPVILGSVNSSPRRRWEAYDTPFKNAAILHRAGVNFAIAFDSGEPNEANERNLPNEAGKAVAFGLSKEEALKAITIYPAEILGVADQLGSLEVGKNATLFISTGDPLDIRSHVEMAFIDGRQVDLRSRHTQLYEKYQQRFQQN